MEFLIPKLWFAGCLGLIGLGWAGIYLVDRILEDAAIAVLEDKEIG